MYRGIIFHETEEGNKIWRGIDFSFQNWHKEFDTPFEQSILFELKKYRGIIFHEAEEGYKIWRGIDSLFQNWHKEFDKI